MSNPVCRLLAGGILLFGLLAASPARAVLGAPYNEFGFKAYLERGYNTRLGWQGWPVSAEDAHLYLYSQDSFRLLAELEYLHSEGRIHTQLFKLYAPAEGLGNQEWHELEYFALEASKNRLGSADLQALVKPVCQSKEWQHGPIYLTLIVDRNATWLRISERGSFKAEPFDNCKHQSSSKPR